MTECEVLVPRMATKKQKSLSSGRNGYAAAMAGTVATNRVHKEPGLISENLERTVRNWEVAMRASMISVDEFRVALVEMVPGAKIQEIKPHKKATELLLRFLNEKQAGEFKKKGYFHHTDDQERIWKFTRQYHFPVQVEFPKSKYWNCGTTSLCVESDPKTPTEDLLLLCYLDVLGGRGDEIIKLGRMGSGVSGENMGLGSMATA